MATTISSLRTGASLSWSLSEAVDLGSISFGANFVPAFTGSFTFGTGAGKVNKLYAAEETIAVSTNLDLDLSGSLLDQLKNAVVFTKLKFIFYEVVSTTLTTATVFGFAVTNSALAWAVPVNNGSYFQWMDATGNGVTVTAGTADLLRIRNADAAVIASVRFCLAGEG